VGDGNRSGRKWAGITALASLPVVAIVAVLIATSGSAGKGPSAKPFTPFAGGTPPPAAGKPGSLSGSPAALAPAPNGSLVAILNRSSDLRASPGGRSVGRLGTRTEFGSPETMLVVRQAPGWLGVISPLAGNGRIGWIPESAARLAQVRFELDVSLSAHRLTVLEGKSVLQRYNVSIGAPGSPTPVGRFAVTDRLTTRDPAGPYGCCILALSARSPHAIQGWTGGNRIAIHSTPDAGSIGQSVSHGCVRVTLDHGRWLLAHIPLGTPTVISS
jgi:hypothetical protein